MAELDLSGTGFSRMHSVPKPPASAWLWGLLGDLSKLSLTQDSGAGGHLQGTCTCCHGNTARGVLQLCLLALTKELFGLKKAAFSPEAAQSQNICLTASHLPGPGDRCKDREASGVAPCGNSPTHRRTASPHNHGLPPTHSTVPFSCSAPRPFAAYQPHFTGPPSSPLLAESLSEN